MDEIEKALASLQLEDGEDWSKAIGTLAEASKTDLRARSGLADASVLKTLTEIVETSIDDDRQTTDLALRCIGNASIDNDEARESLTDIGFAWALRCLRHKPNYPPSFAAFDDRDIAQLAVKVLYNICCDYVPAQLQCFNEHVHYALIHFCTTKEVIMGDNKTLLIGLLYWISGQKKPDSTATDPLPQEYLIDLVQLPRLYGTPKAEPGRLSNGDSEHGLDDDDWPLLVETCLVFIRDAQVQKDIVKFGLVERVLEVLTSNEERIKLTTDEELQKLLIPFSTSLVWCLSDISALPEFLQQYPLDSPLLKGIRDQSANYRIPCQNTRLATAACQILGNSLWAMQEPEQFSWLVTEAKIHYSLWRWMENNEDPELLHATAGVLIQLSRDPATREQLGHAGNEFKVSDVLKTLCKHETPQLKEDGVKLLRALGRDCPVNQQRFAGLEREVREMMAAAQSDSAMSETTVSTLDGDGVTAGPNGHIEP